MARFLLKVSVFGKGRGGFRLGRPCGWDRSGRVGQYIGEAFRGRPAIAVSVLEVSFYRNAFGGRDSHKVRGFGSKFAFTSWESPEYRGTVSDARTLTGG